jgi:hypothetical protein
MALASCAADDSSSSSTTAAPDAVDLLPSPEPALDECSMESLTVINPGQLTVGANFVDTEPYFYDSKPSSGEGFEPALTYAIAAGLGFAPMQVKWSVLDASAGVPAEGTRVDFAIGQIPSDGSDDWIDSVPSDPYLAVGPGEAPFVLLFADGNPLSLCVNGVLATLDATGETQELADEWLDGPEFDAARVGSAARVS